MKTNIFTSLKNTFIGILVLCFSLHLQGQDLQYGHAMFNMQVYNPSSVGGKNEISAIALQRLGMVGFEGGPTTSLLGLNAAVLNNKAGVGLTFVQDKIGANKATYLYADFAYKLQLFQDGTLAFGLKGGFSQLRSDLSQLMTSTTENIASLQTASRPNVGTGIQFSMPNFFVGVACPKMLNYEDTQENRAFYVNAGYQHQLTPLVELRPRLLLRSEQGIPMQTEVSALLYMDDKLWTGPTFRTGDALGLLIGARALDAINIGYCFEYGYAGTGTTSHEFMVSYVIVKKEKK